MRWRRVSDGLERSPRRRRGRGRTEVVGEHGDDRAEQSSRNDVRRVVAVVHRARDGNEGRANEGSNRDPALEGMASTVVDVHLAGQVEREVDEAGEGDCRRQGASALQREGEERRKGEKEAETVRRRTHMRNGHLENS